MKVRVIRIAVDEECDIVVQSGRKNRILDWKKSVLLEVKYLCL